MSTKQTVSTIPITDATIRIRTANEEMNSSFTTLRSKAKGLDTGWKGAAGETACTKLHEFCETNKKRSEILQGYHDMLQTDVNIGYRYAEILNTKLADLFK